MELHRFEPICDHKSTAIAIFEFSPSKSIGGIEAIDWKT